VPSVKRILDANGNRAREALRVMEEAARFVLEDAALAADLKQLRHELSQAVASVPGLSANRDTPGDIGTELSTPTEGKRQSRCEVVIAASKRLGEALRALEEYGKLLGRTDADDSFALRLQSMRYRAYDLEMRLERVLHVGEAVQWRLCLLLTEAMCSHHAWDHVLGRAIDAGADCIQVREKQMEGGQLARRVEEVKTIVAGRASVIVNDRPDIALVAGADGVHLGQGDLNPRDVRMLAGGQLIIGVSTSTLDQAKQAAQDGADYCGIGPMFLTTTKQKDTLAGPAYLREYLGWNTLPHLAIGGIKPDNASVLTQIGCRGVAISAAICAAQDPYQATRNILTHLPPPPATQV